MYTTSVPGVLIDREARDLAYVVASAIQRMLTQTACLQAKDRATENTKCVVGAKEITEAGNTLTIDLVSLIESARVELNASKSARRVA